jgi:effector-binding domain-containing protein
MTNPHIYIIQHELDNLSKQLAKQEEEIRVLSTTIRNKYPSLVQLLSYLEKHVKEPNKLFGGKDYNYITYQYRVVNLCTKGGYIVTSDTSFIGTTKTMEGVVQLLDHAICQLNVQIPPNLIMRLHR